MSTTTNVKITVTPHVEYDDPSDHFESPDQVEYVRELSKRTVWGWCCIDVTARLEGTNLYASEILGGCAYESEVDFRNDPYFADMLASVVESLKTQLAKLKAMEVIL
jgi:hypothetical protein